MEIEIKDEKTIRCVTASSFPEGIGAAFDKVAGMVGGLGGKTFYGLSWGQPDGSIVYKAGIEEKEAPATNGLERFVLQRGAYVSEKLQNYKGREIVIGETFKKMLKDPRLDPNGECIEVYRGDDVECMVRIIKIG